MDKKPTLDARTVARLVAEVASLQAAGSEEEATTRAGDRVPGPGLVGEVDGSKVFLVDGNWVKLHCSMDFVEGGNDMVYEYVSAGQIWIDGDLDHTQIRYVALHEAVERRCMSELGMDYEHAHGMANEVERAVRADNVLGPA